MQKIKIFLASSQELKFSRDEFEKFIRRKNDSWANRNLSLQLIIWEDFIDAVSQTRKQDDYNKAIRNSDILLVLVFSKVGKYTNEEFETGYAEFKKNGNPLIYTYFQFPRVDEGDLTRQEVISVFDFEERLRQLDHFKIKFKSSEDLLLQFSEQIDKLYPYTSSITSVISGLPIYLTNVPRHTDEFIGREEDLKELKKLLSTSEKVVLMNGMAGIGKTTLAKKYVQLHQQDYDHIAWIDVKTQDTGNEFDMTTPEAFVYDVVLSKNLGLNLTTESVDEKFRLVCNSLSNIKGKNLLVIDNAKGDLNEQDIKNILPGPPYWQVIVTSRQLFKGFRPFEVQELSPDQAIELFKTYYAKDAEEKDIDELLREINYHTLTTELLAKTLSFDGQTITISETVIRLKSKQLPSPALQRKIELAHSKKETEAYIHLIQTFDLSLLTEYEKWLMKQFVFLLPKQYEIKELENLLDISDEVEQLKLHESLSNLGKKGWLKTGSYGMHRMIQQMVYYQLEPELKDIEPLIKKLSALLSFDTSTDFTRLFPLIPYAEFILLQLKKDDLEDIKVNILQNNLGVTMRNLGEYEKARDLLEAALISDLKNFGEQHPTVAANRSNLGNVFKDLGEYEKARDLLEAALESDLKNFGEQHPTVATNRSNLGNVFKDLGEYEKARDLLEAALESDLKNLGEQHPTVAVSHSNLAIVYKNLGEYEKARDLLEAALENGLKYLGEQHPKVAVRRSNLANVYKGLGEYEKARDLLEAALTSDLKSFGEQHPAIATRFNNLAHVYAALKDFKAAEIYFEKAADTLIKTVGTEHPNTKKVIKSLEYVKNKMKE